MLTNILSTLILLPMAGALAVFVVSRFNERAAKALSIIISGATLVLAVLVFYSYRQYGAGFQMVEHYPWVESLGMTISLGVDGISLPLLIISTFLTTLASVASWREIRSSPGAYYALLLLFEGAIIGLFVSLDLILFYVFWELVLIPMFFLIGRWGGGRKKYAAMKFLIFTHVGSTVMLLGFIGLYVFSHTFDIVALSNSRLPLALQLPIAIAVFFGFGVKLPVLPLHTWLVDAHVDAPAPVSVLLAGLVLKMGGYGFIRIMLGLLPDASRFLAPGLIGIGIVTMFYAAIAAMSQWDLKVMVALTSINHMGYILVGTFSFTAAGVTASVFQMFNHALAVGALFLLTMVVREAMGTRNVLELSGMDRVMPITSVLLILASLAAMGFPGFANFISEYMIILAAIRVNVVLAIIVLVPAITAGYFMWMLRRAVFRAPTRPIARNEAPTFELVTLAIFLIPLIFFGLYPGPIILAIDATVKSLSGLGLV
jgi:NADH-quinone oxidoreductase subunit M